MKYIRYILYCSTCPETYIGAMLGVCFSCRQLVSASLSCVCVFPSSSDAVVVLNANGGEGLKVEHRERLHCVESIHVP